MTYIMAASLAAKREGPSRPISQGRFLQLVLLFLTFKWH